MKIASICWSVLPPAPNQARPLCWNDGHASRSTKTTSAADEQQRRRRPARRAEARRAGPGPAGRVSSSRPWLARRHRPGYFFLLFFLAGFFALNAGTAPAFSMISPGRVARADPVGELRGRLVRASWPAARSSAYRDSGYFSVLIASAWHGYAVELEPLDAAARARVGEADVADAVGVLRERDGDLAVLVERGDVRALRLAAEHRALEERVEAGGRVAPEGRDRRVQARPGEGAPLGDLAEEDVL